MKQLNIAVILAVSFLLSGGLDALAQTTIKGRVTDTGNQPLVGVSVFFRGTTNGTSTDADGHYSIKVMPGSDILVFSCLGMKEKEVNVKNKPLVNVILEENTNYLDETVVIGYAEVQRKDIMGAVASADSKAVTSVPATNFAEALSGKMAGVSVVAAEGDPDSTVDIKVRGTGSITQDASPLFIVDGAPVNSISDIPAQDIKSIDVLKDAFSTAIYGSRGAYGVVLITTKDAANKKLSVTYDGYFGIKKMANAEAIQVMSPYEYARFQYEYNLLANTDRRWGNVPFSYEPFLGSFEDMDLFQTFEGNNWRKKLFGNTGMTQNHSVTLSSKMKTYWWTANYSNMRENAILLDSEYERRNLSFKFGAIPVKNLSFYATVRYSNTDLRGAGANAINDKGTTSTGRLINALRYAPVPMDYNMDIENYDVYDEYFGANPLRDIKDSDDRRNRENYSANGNVTWTIIPNLKLKVAYGADIYRNTSDRFYGLATWYARSNANPLNQPSTISMIQNQKILRNTNTLNYNFANVIGSRKHKLDVMVGQEYLVNSSYREDVVAGGFPTFYDAEMARNFRGSSTTSSVSNRYEADNVILSFFGRANYVYKGRYSLSATFRADGSSKFAEHNQWGYFPSVAASWDISKEKWMSDLKEINQLKLRYSFGTAGNNRIPQGQIIQTFTASQDSNNRIHESMYNLVKPSSNLVNENLKWETSYSHNIGLDFAFFKARLGGTFELYHRTTDNLLIKYNTPGIGYSAQYRNIGAVLNKGLELTLRGVIVERKNFGLSVSGNIALNKNRVLSLGGRESIETECRWNSGIGIDYIVKEGRSLGEIYGFVEDGWYTPEDFTCTVPMSGVVKWTLKEGIPQSSSITNAQFLGPGSVRIKDVDGDGKIDANDKICLGSALPVGTGGLNLNMNLHGFDFNASFSYSFGNVVYNANKIALTRTASAYRKNLLADMAPGSAYTRVDWNTGLLITDVDTLNEVNKDAKFASPLSNLYLSDAYVEDGSFLRLSSVTLGYTVPQAVTSRIHMSKLRLYVSGSNLFCLTGYSGYDPEVNCRRDTCLTPGVDYSAYPKSIGIIFGLNVAFN